VAPPAAAIVNVFPEGVIETFAPAASVKSPVRVFRLVTATSGA
jgi:hypothetical protein